MTNNQSITRNAGKSTEGRAQGTVPYFLSLYTTLIVSASQCSYNEQYGALAHF